MVHIGNLGSMRTPVVVVLLAAAIVAAPRAADTQQTRKIPRIGMLHPYAPNTRITGLFRQAFQDSAGDFFARWTLQVRCMTGRVVAAPTLGWYRSLAFAYDPLD